MTFIPLPFFSPNIYIIHSFSINFKYHFTLCTFYFYSTFVHIIFSIFTQLCSFKKLLFFSHFFLSFFFKYFFDYHFIILRLFFQIGYIILYFIINFLLGIKYMVEFFFFLGTEIICFENIQPTKIRTSIIYIFKVKFYYIEVQSFRNGKIFGSNEYMSLFQVIVIRTV